MKVVLYFKSFRLGELTYDGNEFIYNSNVEGENSAKGFPSMLLYGLENSRNLKSVRLFDVFKTIKDNVAVRKDILTDIEYTEGDDDFTLLAKYGKVKQNDFKFHLVTEE